MNKEQLIQSIKDLPDQYNINLQVIDNVIHITMTKKVDEFEEYCSKLDDKTFNNACLIFGIISDISLEDFLLIYIILNIKNINKNLNVQWIF